MALTPNTSSTLWLLSFETGSHSIAQGQPGTHYAAEAGLRGVSQHSGLFSISLRKWHKLACSKRQELPWLLVLLLVPDTPPSTGWSLVHNWWECPLRLCSALGYRKVFTGSLSLNSYNTAVKKALALLFGWHSERSVLSPGPHSSQRDNRFLLLCFSGAETNPTALHC